MILNHHPQQRQLELSWNFIFDNMLIGLYEGHCHGLNDRCLPEAGVAECLVLLGVL